MRNLLMRKYLQTKTDRLFCGRNGCFRCFRKTDGRALLILGVAMLSRWDTSTCKIGSTVCFAAPKNYTLIGYVVRIACAHTTPRTRDLKLLPRNRRWRRKYEVA